VQTFKELPCFSKPEDEDITRKRFVQIILVQFDNLMKNAVNRIVLRLQQPYMKRFFFCVIIVACFVSQYNNSYAQGAQWQTLPNVGLINTGGRFDDIYFTSKDTGCLVSANGYLYKTYDGGNYWYAKANLGDTVYFRSIEFSDDGQYGIAGTLAGIVLRTTDRGETWTDISSAISDTGAYPKRMCGLGHWGNSFYGVGWWGGPTARFYKSNDNGLTWQTSYFDSSVATGLVDITLTSQDTVFITGCHFLLNLQAGKVLFYGLQIPGIPGQKYFPTLP